MKVVGWLCRVFGNEGEGVWESGFMGVRGVGGRGCPIDCYLTFVN